MRRFLLATCASLAGMVILSVPHGRGRSIEQLFVAQTQAAAERDSTCTMPPLDDDGQEQRLTIPTSTDAGGADLAPVRMVVDRASTASSSTRSTTS
jgi:hypothetical protein